MNYSAPYLHGHVDILNASIAQIMTIALIAIGAPMVMGQSITIGTLIAAILIAGQIVQPFQRVMTLWLRQRDALTAACRVERILSLNQRTETIGANDTLSKATLSISNMTFGYKNTLPLLTDMNLHITHGTTVALYGASGSGKTTLLELLCGLQQPTEGTITYGDANLCELSEDARSRLIAYLPMHGLILRGSIMDNLTGFDSRQQAAARSISTLLGIDKSVAQLPQGYDTIMDSQNTESISPGLRQRIAIARALIHHPQIILFDNADHGLDKESYTLVFDLLAKLRSQVILVLISEDRNITSLADQEWKLQDGRLQPVSGASEDLIAGMTP